MKKVFLIVLLFFIISNTLYGQWNQIASIGTNDLRAVYFFNEYVGIIAGQGGIWRTTNSGVNWTNSTSISDINALSFLSPKHGLAAGDYGLILKSSNEGLTWTSTFSPSSEHLYAIDWANASVCYAVGANGTLVKSANTGNNWYSQNSLQTEHLKAIYMPDPLNGLLAGGVTKELYGSTVSGGNNWIYPLNQTGNSVNSMHAITLFRNILVGSNGRIRRTTNWGTSWSLPSSGTTENLNAIHFPDTSNGYIAGNNGTILKSTNGGSSWTSQTSSTTNNLKGIHFVNMNTGWAVGSNGIVLRTGIPVGIVNHENNAANTFNLHQNYPNPFNPVTTIDFNIPEDSWVTIKVYNTLGIEIETLFNKFIKAGYYQTQFDASSYPSGIYFYQMNAGNYITSKKMMLIK